MTHVLIEGQVQGIGFRQFIKHNAKKLNIKGWVKNISDGRVEAVFTGENSNLQKMIEICRSGPFLAEVKSLQTEEVPDQKFESFEVVS